MCTDFLMRCADFQLLIPILTILLHLCCRWPPPRFAHVPTLMHSAQSCYFHAEKCCCSGKHQYKSNPFRSCDLVHYSTLERNPSLNKCCHLRGISPKVLLSTRCLLTVCANYGTRLAIDQVCENTMETTSGVA
jgi:hypothetical protein